MNKKESISKKGAKKVYYFVYRNEDALPKDEDIQKIVHKVNALAKIDLEKKHVSKTSSNKKNNVKIIDLSQDLPLVELSLAISKVTSDKDITLLFMIPLQTLLNHNEFYPTIKFVRYLISNLKNKSIEGILLAKDCESTSRMTPQIISQLDKCEIIEHFPNIQL